MRSRSSPLPFLGPPQLFGPAKKIFGVGITSVLGMLYMVASNGKDGPHIFQNGLPNILPTASAPPQVLTGQGGDTEVYFSPNGHCTDAVVREISQARSIIMVQAYSFTSAQIAQALGQAHQRGVRVYIIADKSQLSEKYTYVDYTAHAGIDTSIDEEHAIAHNKIMLIDGETIITGSFNFTKNAETSNAENLLILRGRRDLYAAYEENFRAHYQHSHPYAGRGTEQAPQARYGGQRY
jgi:phosphatidylserine/phosphatidylglycerophosphate/cardiolipin synthase-like enzyme